MSQNVLILIFPLIVRIHFSMNTCIQFLIFIKAYFIRADHKALRKCFLRASDEYKRPVLLYLLIVLPCNVNTLP